MNLDILFLVLKRSLGNIRAIFHIPSLELMNLKEKKGPSLEKVFKREDLGHLV